MDLGAYAQIEDLDKIAKENGIEVPRLRGYRLMSEEERADYSDMLNYIEIDCTMALCEASPFWSNNTDYYEVNQYVDWLKHWFLEYKDNKAIRVRWERIHGWKRKKLKLAIHNRKKRIKNYYDTWNKYVGREDILYIHSRIGGGNWSHYFQDVVNKSWFIEKVDDPYDSTYCDIYAHIDKK